MSAGALVALLAFVGMFAVWVVVPTLVKKRHTKEADPE